MPRRALVVFNRGAGRGRNACSVEAIAREIRSWGWTLETIDCQDERTTDAIASAIAGGVDTVVSLGGDGTANLCAGALIDTDVALGVVPCGTANDFARTLGIPLPIDRALAALRDGERMRIDVGWVNGHHFLNVASLGMGALIARGISPDRKRRWGRWAYALEVLRRLRTPRLHPFTLCLDGGCERFEAYQVAIANGCSFGGGFRIGAEARLDEGLFDVLVIEPGWLRRARKATASGLTLVGRLGSRTYRTRWLEITSTDRVTVNLDGEAHELVSPLHFRVRPLALSVLVARS
ncbi:MAG TPA: diacylglycerol kinase family protein [Pantanalinema sp.]